MPYRNKRNEAVADQVRTFSQNHVNREKEIADFSTSYEIPSQLESAVMRHAEVHGGSGFAAATVQDLGFEPTLGATSGEGKPARKPRKKEKKSPLPLVRAYPQHEFLAEEFQLAAFQVELSYHFAILIAWKVRCQTLSKRKKH